MAQKNGVVANEEGYVWPTKANFYGSPETHHVSRV